jgi:acetyl-CoA carboxylase biotin carboxyl carrier protein
MKDIQFLEKLLELLNSTDAQSIEVKKSLWSTTIRVSKDSLPTAHGGPVTYQVAAAAPTPAPGSPLPAPPSPLPAEEGGAGSREQGAETPEAVEAHLTDITAPMVGTFYAQPEPGAEPYVTVGARVTLGTTLCIIEAMKIMNPIDAEITGVIKEVCVQDAQPVEFGQVLFRVDPNG